MAVMAAWVDDSISGREKCEMREACVAAPRAERYAGLRAVGLVEGEWIMVEGGKREVRLEAIRGVWEVPPERMI